MNAETPELAEGMRHYCDVHGLGSREDAIAQCRYLRRTWEGATLAAGESIDWVTAGQLVLQVMASPPDDWEYAAVVAELRRISPESDETTLEAAMSFVTQAVTVSHESGGPRLSNGRHRVCILDLLGVEKVPAVWHRGHISPSQGVPLA
jgi:hypothetical protein